MKYIIENWSQISVVIIALTGGLGFVTKIVLDYRYKKKELRYKFFYEKKAEKIVNLHNEITIIQEFIDSEIDNSGFQTGLSTKRVILEKYFWDGLFYFNDKTQDKLTLFIEWLERIETGKCEIRNDEKSANQFKDLNLILIKELKKEIR